MTPDLVTCLGYQGSKARGRGLLVVLDGYGLGLQIDLGPSHTWLRGEAVIFSLQCWQLTVGTLNVVLIVHLGP